MKHIILHSIANHTSSPSPRSCNPSPSLYDQQRVPVLPADDDLPPILPLLRIQLIPKLVLQYRAEISTFRVGMMTEDDV
jgi:hypothetical protein